MAKRPYTPHIVVLCLMIATSVGIRLMGDVLLSDRLTVRTDLPHSVGEYSGMGVWYCQSPECARYIETPASESGPDVCPYCGEVVSSMSISEKALLPDDTTMVKKVYKRAGRPDIFVTVVISGLDRLSLHRPQNCLPGQGYAITGQETVGSAAPGIDVAVLTLQRGSPAEIARGTAELTAFGYTYVGNGRVTASQFAMMFWIGYDRLFNASAARWAYISIATRMEPGNEEYRDRIRDFAGQLYPAVIMD